MRFAYGFASLLILTVLITGCQNVVEEPVTDSLPPAEDLSVETTIPVDEPVEEPGEIKSEDADTTPIELPEADNPVTLNVTGQDFAFFVKGQENPILKVQKGDRVVINFTSTSGFHDFVIDEFEAATEQVNTDGSTSVEFTADEVGSFSYYCSVGQHRANGMEGTFIVE